MVPDMPLYSVVIDPQTTPHSIIVSTDLGVLRSLDNGATWQRLGIGLPNVNATSLQIDYTVTPSLLRVGTYGRSAFELTTATGPLLAVNCDLGFGFVTVGTTATRQCSLFNVGSDGPARERLLPRGRQHALHDHLRAGDAGHDRAGVARRLHDRVLADEPG